MSEKLKTKAFIFFLVAPAFLVLIGVVIYPFIFNIVISLSNMSLTHIRDWHLVGLTQYVKVFTEESKPNFYGVFLKTIVWTVVNLVFHVVIGVFLALLLNQKEIRERPSSELFWYCHGLFLNLSSR